MWGVVAKLRILDLIVPSKQRGGLFGTKKMRQQLLKNIGDITFDQLNIPFHCIAVDMCTQSLVEFSEGSVLDAVVASSSIPAIFHPLDKDGMRLIDGGKTPVGRDGSARSTIFFLQYNPWGRCPEPF